MSDEHSQTPETTTSEALESAAPKPPAEKVEKKRGALSGIFIFLGVILLAGLCPVGDVDGDEKMDIAGKWIMLKVMTMRENANVGEPKLPDELPEKPENLPLAGA